MCWPEADLSWQRVKGHDDLVAAFARAVVRAGLRHAYLFTGPPGVGKRLFALQLAKTLLCESPPEGRFDSCDYCVSCRLLDAGTHPDFFQVARPEDKQELPIDTMRQLSEDLSRKPARGGRKITIVYDADDFNDASANSFLKTLEEPAPHSLLILIGTNADLQLPTIRSRCQEIPFAPLPEATVRQLLAADSELDSSLLTRLSRLGEGSPGLARELAEPELWTFRRQLFDSLTRPDAESPALGTKFWELVEEAGKDSGAQRRRRRSSSACSSTASGAGPAASVGQRYRPGGRAGAGTAGPKNRAGRTVAAAGALPRSGPADRPESATLVGRRRACGFTRTWLAATRSRRSGARQRRGPLRRFRVAANSIVGRRVENPPPRASHRKTRALAPPAAVPAIAATNRRMRSAAHVRVAGDWPASLRCRRK